MQVRYSISEETAFPDCLSPAQAIQRYFARISEDYISFPCFFFHCEVEFAKCLDCLSVDRECELGFSHHGNFTLLIMCSVELARIHGDPIHGAFQAMMGGCNSEQPKLLSVVCDIGTECL